MSETTDFKQLIATGKLPAAALAISRALEGKSEHLYNQSLLQLRRVSTLEDQLREGTISHADAELERARISKNLLQLANWLEDPAGAPIFDTPAAADENRYWYLKWLALLTVPLLILLYLALWPDTPEPPGSFDLIAHLHTTAGAGEPLREGKAKVILGDRHFPAQEIDGSGRVVFTDIPSELRTAPVQLAPVGLRYRVVSQTAQTAGESNTITFTLAPLPDTLLFRGTVFDHQNRRVAGAQIDIAGGLAKGQTDELGNFSVYVPKKEGEAVPVAVLVDGRQRYNKRLVLSGNTPQSITLNPPE